MRDALNRPSLDSRPLRRERVGGLELKYRGRSRIVPYVLIVTKCVTIIYMNLNKWLTLEFIALLHMACNNYSQPMAYNVLSYDILCQGQMADLGF